MSRRHPYVELLLANLREFRRNPEVVFWVFGFPVLLAIGLGIAFRNQPAERIAVAIVTDSFPHARIESTSAALSTEKGFDVRGNLRDEADLALRLGHVAIVVIPSDPVEYRFDPTRPDSLHARARVDDALQRAAGRADVVTTKESLVTEPGARYIDFLIPGLLGMNIMSGGMWGIGFALVEMRSRKYLKRLSATPMKKSHFLGAILTSRVILVLLEMALMLTFGWIAFDLVLRGSIASVALVVTLGACTFAGLGLLVASRVSKIESVSGLINLVMLPMFVFSGVFFSSERFPEVVQPFIRALPLTALNEALRALILEGASLPSQAARLGVLALWGVISFATALRIFRWG